MGDRRKTDVLIIGSGPSGMSTAFHLVKHDPNWSQRVVVVDKAIHPREKLCGGGVSQFALKVLRDLDLEFEPPFVAVNEIRIIFGDNVYSIADSPILRITRRDEFDHWLVKSGEARGVEVRQGEAVLDVIPQNDHVEVVTENQVFQAKIVVGADGAASTVRRKLKFQGKGATARLLEVLTPEVPDQRFEFRDGVAVFDFTPMMNGLQGYYWDFPSLVHGKPYMNRGVYDSRTRPEMPRIRLKEEFADQLSKRNRRLEDYELKGHPIHWFDSEAEFSRPHVLLVGDAAGTDSLLGEGIPFALAYGDAASAEIVQAFAMQDFSFGNYKHRILNHPLLKQLKRRTAGARLLYELSKNPCKARFLWQLAPLLLNLLGIYKPHYIRASKLQMIRRDPSAIA